MLKNAKIRAWLETIITNLDGLELNTERRLTFAQQVAKCGTPVATVTVLRGSAKSNGQQLIHTVPIDIFIVVREDEDYEQTMQDLFNGIEDNAFPDFVEAGDTNASPGIVDGYDWEIWPMASESQLSGKIIVRMIVKLTYSNISSRE